MNQISTDFLQRPKVADPLAILVDGENMSLAFAKTLLKEAEAFGVPTVRRVYGKAEHIAGWENEGFRLVPTRPGKNSADLLLCVEAMSLALRESFQTLLIASSDRDFSYLAEHLRELGHQVVGIGEVKAPLAFRKTCSAFVEVATVLGAGQASKQLQPACTEFYKPVPVQKEVKPAVKRPAVKLTLLDEKLHCALGKSKIVLNKLGNAMNGGVKQLSGKSTWRAYLNTRPDLYELTGTGAQTLVRWIGP